MKTAEINQITYMVFGAPVLILILWTSTLSGELKNLEFLILALPFPLSMLYTIKEDPNFIFDRNNELVNPKIILYSVFGMIAPGIVLYARGIDLVLMSLIMLTGFITSIYYVKIPVAINSTIKKMVVY